MLLNLAAAKLHGKPLSPALPVRRQPVGLDKLCADSFPGCCCLIRFPYVISDIGLPGPVNASVSVWTVAWVIFECSSPLSRITATRYYQKIKAAAASVLIPDGSKVN